MANLDFVLVWPVFIVKTTAGKVAGHDDANSGVVAMSLYTDHDLAQTFVDGGGDWVIHPFDNKQALLQYLQGLTGEFTHVVIDPTPHLVAKSVSIPHFIQALQAAG